MKKNLLALLFSLCVFVAFVSCNSHSASVPVDAANNADSVANTVDKNALPVITFENDFHDFGRLVSGEKVTYAFKFKNTGKSVLLISNVSTSCGCTVSAFPKQPIKPGDGASVDVSFDTKGRHGFQTKMITVYTNAEPQVTTLRIQSQVVEPEDI